MGELNFLTEDLVAQCRRVLSAKGRLTTALPGFVPRNAQIELAVAIAKTIGEQAILVAEAGTGTGKTFAYLVPCLLSGKKTLISTATKTLQDQLFTRDLPNLLQALGLSIRVQNLKGRANYICRYRVHLHSEEGRFSHIKDAHELQLIRQRIPRLTEGVRSELPEIAEDSSVWPHATSTTDNCLGNECGFYQECFIVKARRKAMDSDLIVINHHLFFADSRLKENGFGELLPGVNTVVFDEAHQLGEIATHFNGQQFSTRQLRLLFEDLIKEWPLTDLSHQPFKNITVQFDKILDQMLLSLAEKNERYAWERLLRRNDFVQGWQNLLRLLEECLEVLAQTEGEDHKGLLRCRSQIQSILDLAHSFDEDPENKIHWVERFKQTLMFHQTPYDVAQAFSELLQRQQVSYIFTSATITMANSFDCFLKPLGMENVPTRMFPSPFNYKAQSLLYLPRSIPDPKNAQYYEAMLTQVLPIIQACGGRCFFLFTSHRALNLVAEKIRSRLTFPLLVQGEESKSILLARFRQFGNAVLLGTATFWEGVDVKGEALSCVIIDKLPFASPADPVMQGKMAYLRRQGISDFDALSLPNAVLALKQGVGRLIRDECDRGILVIADPRLTGREYGKTIFASLPDVTKTRDRNRVLSFIEELSLSNETVNH